MFSKWCSSFWESDRERRREEIWIDRDALPGVWYMAGRRGDGGRMDGWRTTADKYSDGWRQTDKLTDGKAKGWAEWGRRISTYTCMNILFIISFTNILKLHCNASFPPPSCDLTLFDYENMRIWSTDRKSAILWRIMPFKIGTLGQVINIFGSLWISVSVWYWESTKHFPAPRLSLCAAASIVRKASPPLRDHDLSCWPPSIQQLKEVRPEHHFPAMPYWSQHWLTLRAFTPSLPPRRLEEKKYGNK